MGAGNKNGGHPHDGTPQTAEHILEYNRQVKKLC